MDDNQNFDPFARGAAASGLRGAYDGSDFTSGGNDFGDTSWMDNGYGAEEKIDYSIGDLAKIFDRGGERLDTTQYGGLLENASRPSELNWLPGQEQFKFGDLTGEALTQKLTDLYGDDGLSVYKTRNQENPLKSQTVYFDDGNVIGSRNHTRSNGFLDKYGMALGKSVLAAGLGSAMAPMFAGMGGLGGTAAGAATKAGIGSLLNGANFGTSFAANMVPGLDVGAMGTNFGEYTDLINKSLRGAAGGVIAGGGAQGALLGAASPVVNQGMSKLGDYFSNTGNQWDQDSFGSGGMSMGNNGGLNNYFQNYTGQQNGPMSSTASLQQSTGGGNGIDWNGVLNGTQAFGNTNPQEQQPTGLEGFPGMQGSGFMQMPFSGDESLNMAGAPNSAAGSQGWSDDYAKQIPDALKAVLMARYPQLKGVLGQGPRMSPLAAGAGALATLYTAHRADKDLKQQQGQLNSLFGQNSAYSKQLRQELSRKDAAAGRRSQYGPREVELQAKLAQMNGQLAPQRFALAGARDQNRLGMYGGLLQYGEQSGLLDKLSKLLG